MGLPIPKPARREKEKKYNSLTARTPLLRKTPLLAKTPLARRGEGLGYNPPPALCATSPRDGGGKGGEALRATSPRDGGGKKRTSRYSSRSYTHLQKRGYCAMCGKSGDTVWHHIIFRSQGGTEDDWNMLELGCDFCCSCHADIHAGRIGAEEVRFARLTAGSYLKEAAV